MTSSRCKSSFEKKKELERTISGVDLLEMTLNGGIVVLYPYNSNLPGFQKTRHNVCTVTNVLPYGPPPNVHFHSLE